MYQRTLIISSQDVNITLQINNQKNSLNHEISNARGIRSMRNKIPDDRYEQF